MAGAQLEPQLVADPALAFYGAPVTLSGWVDPADNGGLQLAISGPGDEQPELLDVHPEQDGSFSLTYERTRRVGTYDAVARLPDGDSPRDLASTTSSVVAAVAAGPLFTELAGFEEELGDDADELRPLIADYPDFPRKQELLGALDDVETQLEEVEQLHAQIVPAFEELNAWLETEAAGLSPEALDALADATQAANDAAAGVAPARRRVRALVEQSRRTAEWCHRWQTWKLAFAEVSWLLSFASDQLLQIAENLLLAHSTGNLPFAGQAYINTCVALLRNADAGGTSYFNALGFGLATAVSLAGAVFDEMVTSQCTRYDGEVEGHLFVQYLHRGMPYLVYSYHVKGPADLVFQQIQGDEAVALKGRLRLSASDFQ